MLLRVLGAGTMMPEETRSPSSYLVEYNGRRLLLDCGHLTLANLVDEEIDLHSIDAVGITHFHTDHFADLLPLVHARFVDDITKRRPHHELLLLGPNTLKEKFEKLREVFWPEPEEKYPLRFQEVSFDVGVGPFQVSSQTILHVPYFQSVGFHVTCNGKRLFYIGDMHAEQWPGLADDLANIDLLLIEAAATKSGSETHLSAKEAIEFGLRCRAKQIVLTHMRENQIDATQKAIQRSGASNIVIAYDGDEIEI